DVAGFADRLAVVNRLQHRKQTGVFLHVTGNRIQMSRTNMPAQLAPRLEGSAGGSNRIVHVLFATVGNVRQLFARRRIPALEVFAAFRLCPLVVDEQTDLAFIFVQPRIGSVRRLWRGSIFHRVKNLGYAHKTIPSSYTLSSG